MKKEQRLYIDGVLMDLGDDVEITLDIKSNLFRDVTKITANNTGRRNRRTVLATLMRSTWLSTSAMAWRLSRTEGLHS